MYKVRRKLEETREESREAGRLYQNKKREEERGKITPDKSRSEQEEEGRNQVWDTNPICTVQQFQNFWKLIFFAQIIRY